MKRFLTSTALVLSLALPAQAEMQSGMFMQDIGTEAKRASDLMGARLYVSEVEVDIDAGVQTDWNDVGEIEDIVIGADGEVKAVVVDIGGFLGMGEHRAAINMGQLRFVSDGPERDEYFVVLTTSVDALKDAPEVQMDHAAAMDHSQTDTARVTARDNTTMFNAPDITRDGYDRVMPETLTTEDVTGARVYDTKDQWVGEVSMILLDGDKLGQAVIDVGGFLGLGEKPVAVEFTSLSIERAQETGELRVYIDATEAQLEALPEFEG